MDSFAYEIPSAAGGDEGLEGFSVEAHGERVGRLAAINRTPAGLVLLVDTGDAYRPVPADGVAEVQMGGETIVLSPRGDAAFAASHAVDPRTNPAEGPRLVRHIPPELMRLMTAGGTRRSRSGLWFVGGGLVLVAGFAILPVHLLIEHEVGGAARGAWLADPVLLLVAGGWAIGAAIDRDAGRRVPLRDKLADAPALFLGISPRTRNRG
jgi:hypothetical protein